VRVDTTAPTVAISSPANGATITSKQLTIAAAASDGLSGPKSVEFYVDGRRVGTDGAAPFSYGWKTSRGAHTLTAIAADVAGNTATAAPVSITVR